MPSSRSPGVSCAGSNQKISTCLSTLQRRHSGVDLPTVDGADDPLGGADEVAEGGHRRGKALVVADLVEPGAAVAAVDVVDQDVGAQRAVRSLATGGQSDGHLGLTGHGHRDEVVDPPVGAVPHPAVHDLAQGLRWRLVAAHRRRWRGAQRLLRPRRDTDRRRSDGDRRRVLGRRRIARPGRADRHHDDHGGQAGRERRRPGSGDASTGTQPTSLAHHGVQIEHGVGALGRPHGVAESFQLAHRRASSSAVRGAAVRNFSRARELVLLTVPTDTESSRATCASGRSK